MVKQLSELLGSTHYTLLYGAIDIEIKGITLDSRTVQPDSLFVARKGEQVDGHRFIREAISRGAVAVIGESFEHDQIQLAKEKEVCLIVVNDSVHIGGVVVAAFYDFPFLKMTMIGITGTDGKTTTSQSVYSLLKSLGRKVGLISTVSAKIFNGVNEYEMETGLHVTTPEVTEIQRLLAEMVSEGCEYAILEATSHGFVQGRLGGINFDVVGITNITHEHLDYHHSFEAYLQAKSQIFSVDADLPHKETKRIALLNADDQNSEGFRAYADGWELRTFSVKGTGMLNARDITLTIRESQFQLAENNYKMPLVGAYNVANVTLALGIGQAMGCSLEAMVEGVAALQNPPGRFEVIDAGEHGIVIIDFAHTPHAMESVVSFVRNHHKGKLYVVFGCAGLRDVEKRPMMGKIAGRLADVTVVTAEDPRTETVEDITAEIVKGLEGVGARDLEFQIPNNKIQINSNNQLSKIKEQFGVFIRVTDRYQAIKVAIEAAGKGDVVMILGKGHEKSMCFGEVERSWSDRGAVMEILSELKRV